MRKPYVAAIVHAVGPDEHCTAAIVTEVRQDDSARLTLFTGNGPRADRSFYLPDEPGGEHGTWHWPEDGGE